MNPIQRVAWQHKVLRVEIIEYNVGIVLES